MRRNSVLTVGNEGPPEGAVGTADPLTIAYMGKGAGERLRGSFGVSAVGDLDMGELEVIDAVIAYAWLADAVAGAIADTSGHPCVFAYEVAEPFGCELTSRFIEGLPLPEAAPGILQELLIRAGYPQQAVIDTIDALS